MGADLIELTRGAFSALDSEDHRGLLDIIGPGFYLVSALGGVEGRYEGLDGMRRYLGALDERWTAIERELLEIRLVAEGRVATRQRTRAIGRASRVPVEIDTSVVFTYRGGLLTSIEYFEDHERALAAAGAEAPVQTARVLSIAGSDSGGGAGIQADLKALARCGVHGMTAITAITAQNTVAVTAVEPVSPEMIVAQVEAVASDIGVDAVKIGMLGDATTIAAVAAALDLLPGGTPVVLDPVMVSESGAVLLAPEAREALVTTLVPRAMVITPNLPEARVLSGLGDDGAAEDLARALHALGPANVVVTGGHREESTDLFFDGTEFTEIPGERFPDGAAHGSGCTHSSALAAHLARGLTPLEAARAAREIAAEAVRDGLRDVGEGAGPVSALGRLSRPLT